MSATITDKNGNVIEEFTQWDSNRTIYIHGLDVNEPPVVHFSNRISKKSYPVESELNDGVIITEVPNILLEESEPIAIHIYTYDIDTMEGRTIELIKVPVRSKMKPDDYVHKENITVVNVVALNTKVKELIRTLPTNGRLNGTTLEITTVVNGVTVVLFSIDLSAFEQASYEEANEYLFGGDE